MNLDLKETVHFIVLSGIGCSFYLGASIGYFNLSSALLGVLTWIGILLSAIVSKKEVGSDE